MKINNIITLLIIAIAANVWCFLTGCSKDDDTYTAVETNKDELLLFGQKWCLVLFVCDLLESMFDCALPLELEDVDGVRKIHYHI